MELHAYFAAQATHCRTDADYMALALVAAEVSGARGEVPVGAILVHKDRGFLAVGVNGREMAKNALWHAEMEAIDRGCQVLGGWRLTGCTLYVTLEPCPMCAGAMVMAQLDGCVFGAYDARQGCCGSVYDLPHDPAFFHRVSCVGGVLEDECARLLRAFFEKRRGENAPSL